HSCGRGCAQYQRRVWEARRISSERPNPRFTGRGLPHQQPIMRHLSWIFVSLWVLYGSLAFVVTIVGKHLPLWVSEHVDNWMATTVILVLVLVGKIIYINMQIAAETEFHKHSSPICDIPVPYVYSLPSASPVQEGISR